ncbi:hypothetical protein F5880DRAFT_1476040, partial [Lentinula raphanica]
QGETTHRTVKRAYRFHTNHRRYAAQIAKNDYRVRFLQRIRHFMKPKKLSPGVGFSDDEPLPYSDPSAPYHIALGQKYPVDIRQFVSENKDDIAMQDFVRKLKRQILYQLFAQVLGKDAPAEISNAELNALIIKGNKLFKHKVIRINYTTYDLRRDQDSINPRTHPDIITLSSTDSSHPFTYGRIIGIFHANVMFSGTQSIQPIGLKRVDILWIRWYRCDESYESGFEAKQQPRVYFMDPRDPAAFDFLDPIDVIRAVHIIPAFQYSDVEEEDASLVFAQDSIARVYEHITVFGTREIETEDWSRNYVNM